MKNIFKKIISTIIQLEARAILKKYKPKIVAITGSVGKTSTKDAIYAVMAKSFYARKSEKSFNSDIGIPLTIMGCNTAWDNPLKWLQNIWVGLMYIVLKKKYPEWLVLEVGADRPGDIKKVSAWLKPNIAVVTKFADVPVHIEYFKSKAEVIAEKGNLVDALRHDGTLILNSDDSDVFAFKNKFSNKIISYGMMGDALVRASNYSVYYSEKTGEPFGINFKVEYMGNCLPVKIIGTLGANNIYASLAAISVGLALGLNLVESTESLLKYVPPRGRMNLLRGISDSTIVDDTYNSSPVATTSALNTLKDLKLTTGRKIAILGDMMELGKYTVESHEKAGELASQSCDILVTVGLRSRALAEKAIDMGMSEKNVLQFDNSIEAGKYVKTLIKTGDIILVKGSQSTRMERVVKDIMLEIDSAADLLVRQDEEWQKR
jgi:UDP-N-acetylmuramoyl-tripeptide--D-alanyl-D-alanine ligase